MTVFANRVGDTQNIKVQFTYGPVTASIDEHVDHLAHFHVQLGQLIESVKASETAKQA